MSVFNAETEQQTPSTEVETTQNQESFIAKLVEERGEKWSDPEVIAKGKLESDKYIAELEKQLKDKDADIQKNEYAKTLLDTLQNKAGDTANPNSEDKGGNVDPNTTDETKDLKSLIEETLGERDKEKTVAENLAVVEKALTQTFGSEASKIVQAKAAETGLSLTKLQEIASESPTAFLSLVGSAPALPEHTLTPSVNTQGGQFNNPGEQDFNHYQEIRRTNPKLYYSPKVQQSMLNDRNRLGERFYNKG